MCDSFPCQFYGPNYWPFVVSLTVQEHHCAFGSTVYRLTITQLTQCLWGCPGWWSGASQGAHTHGCALMYLLTCHLLPSYTEMPDLS